MVNYVPYLHKFFITIDRTQWGVLISQWSVWFGTKELCLCTGSFTKLGSSNLSEQKSSDSGSTVIQGYKVVVLGDRVLFCGFGFLAQDEDVYYLRLKRDEFIQIEGKFGCA